MVVAMPVIGTVRRANPALLEIEMVPLAAPAEVGANTALIVVLPPAAIVIGVVIPETLKPVPEALTDEIVRLSKPVFCTVTVFELLAPVATFPNAKLLGDRVARARKVRKLLSCADVACTATNPKTIRIAARVRSEAKMLRLDGLGV